MRFGAFVVDPKLLCLNALLHYINNLISFFSFLQCVLFYLPDVANIRHAYRNLSYSKYG